LKNAQRLQHSGLAGIITAKQHRNGVKFHHSFITKPFKVPDGQFG
jgi:hypothetical protein